MRFSNANTLTTTADTEVLEWHVALEDRPAEVVERHIRKVMPPSAFLAIGRKQ